MKGNTEQFFGSYYWEMVIIFKNPMLLLPISVPFNSSMTSFYFDVVVIKNGFLSMTCNNSIITDNLQLFLLSVQGDNLLNDAIFLFNNNNIKQINVAGISIVGCTLYGGVTSIITNSVLNFYLSTFNSRGSLEGSTVVITQSQLVLQPYYLMELKSLQFVDSSTNVIVCFILFLFCLLVLIVFFSLMV